MQAQCAGLAYNVSHNPVKQGYRDHCTKEEPEAQKVIVIVQIEMSRKRLIWIPNQHVSDPKGLACSVTVSCVLQWGDRSPRTWQSLADGILTTDCPLPLNTHRFFVLNRCVFGLFTCL